MVKKSTTKERSRRNSGENVAPGGKKRLDIKQIRSRVEELLALPDGAPMPDWSDLTIGDRLAVAVRMIPKEQRQRVLGITEYQFARYERGTDIPLTVVARLAAETEIPIAWLVSGRAMDRLPPLVRIVPGQQADAADVPVQKLAFKAAAGRGEMILDETADHIRFPRMILQALGVAPQNARLMEASGESMKSTINDGDLLLVDVSPAARDIVEGKIYVFSISDDAYVKRLRRAGGGVVMISDNREMFPPEEVPKDAPLRIFGRVMWAGRSL